ncbi:MAG: hypothetical protein AB7F75_12940 [Planctomycetota bacterium]
MSDKREVFGCDVCLIVDCNGDYAVGQDEESAAEAYEELIGAMSAAGSTRYVWLKVRVPAPQALEMSVVCPEQSTPSEAAVIVEKAD